ncbi:ribonuclease H-like domain-containing protein, partial [Candidatus Aerophobetes bacterium]|nr:ribonuclease H-like domain-containing protein [Candidatus Aerophobetes bacterium]
MKVEFFILDADYEQSEKESFVRLFGVTEEGKTLGVSFPCQPYFYVLPREPDLAEKEIREVLKDKIKIRKIEREEKFFEESKKTFLKIFCYLPQDVQKTRDIVKQLEKKRGGSGSVIEEYEYSINLYRRFLLDRNIPGSCWVEVEGEREKSDMKVDFFIKGEKIKPVERLTYPPLRMLSFDIETYEGVKEKKIIMVSLWTDKFHKVITYQKSEYPEWVEVVEDEKRLLERFFEILDEYDPDVIFSYNGDAFDFPVIQERASKNKIELLLSRDAKKMRFTRRARVSSAKIKGRVHIDLYNFINNILAPNLQTEALTLDAVAGELLGDEKIEMDYQELLESWRKSKNLEKLASYSLKDAQLTFDLGLLLLPQMLELSSTVGQLLFDTSRMTYGQLAEWFLTQKAVEQNRIIPNQPKWEEIQKRRTFTYPGGFVKEPVGGVHENIAVLDFRSLYPSIIATFNISPETLNCPCHKENGYKVPETDYWFCIEKKGFVSGVIEELITRRAKLKKELSMLPEDSPEYRILNNRQNSLKIVANATYGMFAFAGAKWYCRECAESCASFGRFFINQVIKEAEGKNF